MVIISKCNAEWQVVCFMMKNVQSLWYSKLRSLTSATRSHGTNQITRHKPGYTGQIRNQTWPPGTARRSRLRRNGSYVKYVLKKTKTFLIQWNTITLYVMRRIDNSIWGSHNVTLISCLFETSNSKVYLVVLNTSVPSYIFKERTRILHLNWWKFDDFKKHRIKYR